MAYTGTFNPDALPAHAEPEQAAQILSKQNQQIPLSRPSSLSSPSGQSVPQNQLSYQSKPQPPIPPTTQNYQTQLYQQQPPLQTYHHQQPPPQPYHQQQQPLPQQHPYNHPNNRSHSPSYNPNGVLSPSTSYNPNQAYHLHVQTGRSPTPSRPSASPQATSDAALFPLFKAVDKKGTGQLTEDELRSALVNGDFTSFDPHTVRMMIRMFDADRSGTIGFDEFCGLWGFLAAWRALFDRFDEDHSGAISYDEYSKALIAFGYNLSMPFVTMLYRTYDRRGTNSMSFDIFVQSCISLKRMTDVFKRYDSDRDGYITLSFEEFLTEILLQR